MSCIEVWTFLSHNSADYAELLYRSMERFKSGNYKIKYRAIKSVGFDRVPKGWTIVSEAGNVGFNNQNHAAAMHEALKHISAMHQIFIDADMCILYKDWDKVIFNELNKRPVFGTAYGDTGHQYHKFPNVFMFCFLRGITNMVNLDFRPLQGEKESPVRYKITNQHEAKCFGKNVGDTIKCDTGWRLPLVCGKASIGHAYMHKVLGCDSGHLMPFKDKEQEAFCLQKPEHMAEWHWNGKLFCTHKQASRNHPLNGEWGRAWKDRIDLYTKKEFDIVF